LNDINFVTVDSETIKNKIINDTEKTFGETLSPGDERRIFLLQEVPIIVGLKNDINNTGKQNLLRYATGAVLDEFGNRVNTPRNSADYAITTFRYTLSATRTEDTPIAAGKRATPEGELQFATVSDLVIPAGQLTGDVKAKATKTGKKYNGFIPGQIKNIVDTIPYVASVTNIDTSSGGADIESDDDGINVWSGYRERIRQAPSGFSTAGPADAYAYWAKSASSNIKDVVVTFPSGGHVLITVLMSDGQMPLQTILDAVLAACNNRKRRPMTDYVTAAAPTQVTYNIDLTYYISSENQALEASIKSAVEGSGGAIETYKAWQCSGLGKTIKSINPDELRVLVKAAGASRMVLTSPIYTALNDTEVASIGTITVTYGGLE
jgi:phage-related baseplate assembly protein